VAVLVAIAQPTFPHCVVDCVSVIPDDPGAFADRQQSGLIRPQKFVQLKSPLEISILIIRDRNSVGRVRRVSRRLPVGLELSGDRCGGRSSCGCNLSPDRPLSTAATGLGF
jgi:hypothetical protein